MSKEYIEREAAIAVADYAVDEHPYDKDPEKPETFSPYNNGWHDACDYIRDKLEDLPDADVVEVEKVSEMLWYMVGDDCPCIYNGIGEWLPEECECSETECPSENHACWKKFIKHFYCHPNCGAVMDGGKHE